MCFADRDEISDHTHKHKYVVIPAKALDTSSAVCPGWTDAEVLTLIDQTRVSGVGNFWASSKAVKSKSPNECEDCFKLLLEPSSTAGNVITLNPLKGKKIEPATTTTEAAFRTVAATTVTGNAAVVLPGYHVKRQEFDVEFDDNAELSLADLEFLGDETAAELELKMEVLRMYDERLKERRRAKDFALSYLLEGRCSSDGCIPTTKYPRSVYEQELADRLSPAVRFFRGEEMKEFIELCAAERRILELMGKTDQPDFRVSKKTSTVFDKAKKMSDALKRADVKEKLRAVAERNGEVREGLAGEVAGLMKTQKVERVSNNLFHVVLAEY